jgi:predicted nucleic acid-binding Zn ribbon protein
MRRLAPRALSTALEGVLRDVAPATLLARVQAVWGEVAGPRLAAAAAPVSERDGVVTVACESAVWAQELELLGPDLLTRFGEALAGQSGRPAAGSVKKLRFTIGSHPNQ